MCQIPVDRDAQAAVLPSLEQHVNSVLVYVIMMSGAAML